MTNNYFKLAVHHAYRQTSFHLFFFADESEGQTRVAWERLLEAMRLESRFTPAPIDPATRTLGPLNYRKIQVSVWRRPTSSGPWQVRVLEVGEVPRHHQRAAARREAA